MTLRKTSRALTVESGSSRVRRVIQRENDGVRWELQPDFAPLLESLLHSPGQTIKASPVKRVTRHEISGKIFYVKRYLHHAVALRPLKYFFKPTQAREEWRLAHELEARQIPIVRHVALGERRSWRGVEESILVTEGFDGVQLLPTSGVDPAAILRLVMLMHDQGVLQRDLHPGNLLVRKEPFEIRLVDLDGIVVFSRLTQAQRDENLCLLRVFFAVPIRPELRKRSQEMRRLLFFARARRCLRTNRDFVAQDHGGLKWQVRIACLNAELRQVLSGPDEFLASRAVLLKNGKSSTVGKKDGIVVKRFNLRKAGNLLKDLFRASKAKRAFRKAYHLELVGIPTPRGFAVASKRVCGLLIRSYMVMEEIAGAIDLGAKLRENREVEISLARQAGRLIAKLHDEGFSHRDLKESNLLVNTQNGLHLIDLDGVTFLREVSDCRCAADLGRLAQGVSKYPAVTIRHRFAFLLSYCRARQLRRIPRGR